MFIRQEAVRVSLAYRYHNPNWDTAKNKLVYGADHNVIGLGANMTVWLKAQGMLNAKTEMLVGETFFTDSLATAKRLLDHRCLFEVEPWFESRVPTLENIAVFVAESLHWPQLRVEENASWMVEINKKGGTLFHSFAVEACRMQIGITGAVDPDSGLIAPRAPILRAVEDWKKTVKLDAKPLFIFNSLREKLPALSWIRLRGPQNWAFEFRA